MLLQDIAHLPKLGCPIKRPCPFRGFVALKSMRGANSKLSETDCLADDWEPWPRSDKEREVLKKHLDRFKD